MNSVLLEEAIELFDSITSTLPQSLNLSAQLRSATTSSTAIGGGHTCDIFCVEIPWNEDIISAFNSRCDLTENERRAKVWKVAVKKARIHLLNGLDREGRIKFLKRHAREVSVWSTLDHPNILPLLGYTKDEIFVVPSLMTPWMENGTAREYLKSNRGLSTIMNVTEGFTKGLCYLHSKGIVHGDLKADNILVSSSGVALIADFGISRTINSGEFPSLTTTSHSSSGTLRWMARELIIGDNHNDRSLSSDIWSYGMTVYEFLTGKVPFQHISKEPGVIRAIDNCDPPYDLGNPPSFTSKAEASLMKICEFCWTGDPEMRPTSVELLSFLNESTTNTRDFPFPPSSLNGAGTTTPDFFEFGPAPTLPSLHSTHSYSTSISSSFTVDSSDSQYPQVGPAMMDALQLMKQHHQQHLSHIQPEAYWHSSDDDALDPELCGESALSEDDIDDYW